MDVTWQLLVWSPDGTPKETVGLTSAVGAIRSASVTGAGNCLEAEFDAVPAAINIPGRDIVQIQARVNGSLWASLYKGVTTKAGARRAVKRRPFKLVGLKKRLYEVPITARKITGADVAVMVNQALTSVTLPAGVTYNIADVPTQGFERGDRYPALESVGDFLDALVATVGTFVVAAETTYTFNGVTYNPGDVVPATVWGVRGDGSIFFTRPQAAPVLASESDELTTVTWADVSAEEVYDATQLIYASAYQGLQDFTFFQTSGVGATAQPAPHPIAYTSTPGEFNATRRVTLNAPLDHMTDVAVVGLARPEWTNPENAVDGDDATFAESTDDHALSLRIDGFWPSGSPGVIARVRYRRSGSKTLVLLQGGGEAAINRNLWLRAFWHDGNGSRYTFFREWLPQEGSLEIEEEIWVLPVPAEATGATHLQLSFEGASGVRIYTVEMFVVDEAVAKRLAANFTRPPQHDASTVRLQDQLGRVGATMTLTPDGENPQTQPIERIEYSLTREGGLTTTYHLGQAYDADLESQRALLEAIATTAARRA
jgi:hypothetical protein